MPQRNWQQKLSPVLHRPEFTENPDKSHRVIVELASGQRDRIAAYVDGNQGKVHRHINVIPSMVIELPYEAIQMLAKSNHVKRIWHDTKVRTMLDTAVPTTGSSKAHNLGFTGKEVTVAVIDTGIYPHPDLIYPENRIVAWNDFVNSKESPYDDNGHGTHVAGIIAGNGTASRGRYTGMAPEAKLVGLKALDQDGSGNTSDIISAIEWCIDNQATYNIKAINLSIGGTAQDSYSQDPLCRATSAAWRSGIAVCVAAGNDGPNVSTINTPAINPNVITVGNLDDQGTVDVSDDILSDSSSRGPTIDNLVKPDILAPGTNVMSLRPGRGYRQLSGTSMATPMVTGAVAQVAQKFPSMKPDQIKRLLVKNARDMKLEATFQGAGALNIENAFNDNQKSSQVKLNPFINLSNIFGDLEPSPLAVLALLPIALGF